MKTSRSITQPKTFKCSKIIKQQLYDSYDCYLNFIQMMYFFGWLNYCDFPVGFNKFLGKRDLLNLMGKNFFLEKTWFLKRVYLMTLAL